MASAEVFISHRSSDDARSLAEALYNRLIERGISAFLDTKKLEAGDDFSKKIIESVRKSRVVVVFFEEEMTSWLHFESACAFFDEKLIPVSVDEAKVPPPYSRIQHETITTHPTGDFDDPALERVVLQVEHKLLGATPRAARMTRIFRWLNSFFIVGLWVLTAFTGTVVLFGWSPGSEYQHIKHLHVVLGSIILGGQFFLALAFARAARSPSFREREYGFETTEKLFVVWLVFALIQPILGLRLLMTYSPYASPNWIVGSLALYPAAVVFTLVGYVIARSARELDRNREAPHRISGRYYYASLLFLMGFVVAVWVVNLMVSKTLPKWPF